ncbi:MAG: DUF2905 domain-containing protein [Dehalococcoidia bacterium]|jgi:hypothetical protein|nr:DUF2905 domain-containing protein [Dehalococcoidia bacterium]
MGLEGAGKWLMLMGLALAAVGGLIWLGSKVPFLGRLPGDILIHKGNFTFYFPLITSLVVSLLLTILVNLVLRILR